MENPTQKGKREGTAQGKGVRQIHGAIPAQPQLAVFPQTNYLASLSLSFRMRDRGVMTSPLHLPSGLKSCPYSSSTASDIRNAGCGGGNCGHPRTRSGSKLSKNKRTVAAAKPRPRQPSLLSSLRLSVRSARSGLISRAAASQTVSSGTLAGLSPA